MPRLPFFLRRFCSRIVVGAMCAIGSVALSAPNAVEPRLTATAASAPGVRAELSWVSQRIINATNAFRKQETLRPVEGNPRLSEAAAYFADYMARTSEYSHEADGGTPASRANRFGYDHCIISENIAYQFNLAGFTPEQLAERLVEGWKHSPGHRKNMLDPDISDIGVATARSAKTGYYYAVQMFGRAKSSTIAFAIANRSGTAFTYTLGDQKFPLSPRTTRSHEGCRPAQLMLLPPGGEPQVLPVQPDNGDRFVVLKENGSLAIRKEGKKEGQMR